MSIRDFRLNYIFVSLILFFLPISLSAQYTTVSDYEGNVYRTVFIGYQEWMAENLRATKYSDGTPIDYPGDNDSIWVNITEGAYAWYNNDEHWKEVYGALYNWHTVTNENGLCPSGWHVPSIEDKDQLVNYLVENEGADLSLIGQVLKSCRQVNSIHGAECDTEEHPRWNAHSTNYGTDDFGFSVLPGGSRSNTGIYGFLGSSAAFWLSDESSTEGSAHAIHFSNFNNFMGTSHSEQIRGYSVRCVRDIEPEFPEMGDTGEVSGITATYAKSGGNVIHDGNAPVTARGIVWSTSPEPTVENNEGITSDGTGTGGFSSTMLGLAPVTTYHVRAYATNIAGTSYSSSVQFTTAEAVTTLSSAPQGEGTTSNPYLISTLNELLWISENPGEWDKHYLQTDDIDASATSLWSDGNGWQPIGTGTTRGFTGVYDGGGRIIDQLFIYRMESGQGLFGYILDGAVIKNIGVTNAFVNGGDWYVGALVGYSGASHVDRCFSTGVVTGLDMNVGGLVGRNHYRNSSYSSITNSYSKCDVTGGDRVGGLIGKNSHGSTITNSYSTGRVTGTGYYTGGFAGRDMTSTQEAVSNYWNIETSGQSSDLVASGKTTNQMREFSTFLWWDFKGELINGTDNVWNIGNGRNEGYPYLVWQYPEDPGISALFSGGAGTEQDPYLISNARELNLINFHYLDNDSVYFALIDDISLNVSPFNEGEGWVPIGTGQHRATFVPFENARTFSGNFDGRGFVVKGLFIERWYGYQGLFGYLNNAHILNLGVTDADISGGARYIGGLAGFVSNSSLIEACHTTGSVRGMGQVFISSAGSYTGGFVGVNEASVIRNSSSEVEVTGSVNVGGFAGLVRDGGTIHKCKSTGDVTSIGMTGGFVGMADNQSDISNSYSHGSLLIREGDSESGVGGFAGINIKSAVNNSFSTGSVLYQRSAGPTNKGFAGVVDIGEGYQMTDNYWDLETSNQQATGGNALGRTTDDMTWPYGDDTFEEWDLVNTWVDDIDAGINKGYPYLSWETKFFLRLRSNPAAGGKTAIKEEEGFGPYESGTTLELSASANDGFWFVNWTDEEGVIISTDPDFDFVLPGARTTLTANFDTESYRVSFTVVDEDGNEIDNAVITFNEELNTEGNYVFEGVTAGEYRFHVTADGYEDAAGTVTVTDDDVTWQVTLHKIVTHSFIPGVIDLKVYPNPAGDHVYIESPCVIRHIRVIGIDGASLVNLAVYENNTRIDISHLQSGIYLIQVVTDEGIAARRIQVSR